MRLNPIYLIYGAIAIGVVLMVEGMYYLLSDAKSGARAVNRRMRMLTSGMDSEAVLLRLTRPDPINWEKFGSLAGPLSWLSNLISRSGISVSTTRVLLMMGGITLLCFAGIYITVQNSAYLPSISWNSYLVFSVLMFSLGIGIAGPIAYLTVAKNRRRKQFGEQLPDALDMMVRSLRVGHPVSVAIGLTAEQMPDPIGSAFGTAVDEMTYGLDLSEAMANLADRIDVPDFKYVVMSITIQNDTGGNLADVLSGLATVIRARFRMFKQIQALSAEGRFSAKILGALPFIFAALVFTAKPQYYLNVINEPLFAKVMIGALVLQTLGIFIMHKMINFRI